MIKETLDFIHGYKTYSVCIALFTVSAIYFLLSQGEATLGNPAGADARAVQETIGTIGMMIAAMGAALRHGQKRTEVRLIKEIRNG